MNASDLRQQILFVCGEEDDNMSLVYDPAHVQRFSGQFKLVYKTQHSCKDSPIPKGP